MLKAELSITTHKNELGKSDGLRVLREREEAVILKYIKRAYLLPITNTVSFVNFFAIDSLPLIIFRFRLLFLFIHSRWLYGYYLLLLLFFVNLGKVRGNSIDHLDHSICHCLRNSSILGVMSLLRCFLLSRAARKYVH